METNTKTLQQFFEENEGKIFAKFKNPFTFMNYCYEKKLTPDNSITFYDEKTSTMHIAW